MTLTIRDVRAEDVPVLCRLMGELGGRGVSPEQMEDRLRLVERSPIDSLYLCEEDGVALRLLGFRIRENLEEQSRYGEISLIVVDAGARRRGIGRFMMEYAERLAREKGCLGTWLVSGFGREEQAHRFYKDLGYEVTGYRFVKPLKW